MLVILALVVVAVVAGGVVVGLGSSRRRPGLRRVGFAAMGVGTGILVLFDGLVVFGELFND